MTEGDLPAGVRDFVHRHLPSMDHVAILLLLRLSPGEDHDEATLARVARLEQKVALAVLGDLVAARLVARRGDFYRYAPASEEAVVVDRLADMYNTKPVTLVRTIYERPPSAAKSFADAFRIRKSET
jgi:hypothetical protein